MSGIIISLYALAAGAASGVGLLGAVVFQKCGGLGVWMYITGVLLIGGLIGCVCNEGTSSNPLADE